MADWVGSEDILDDAHTWISPVRFRERHDTVQGTAYSDVGGTLFIEQSSDGTFDNEGGGEVDFFTSVTVTAGAGQSFSAPLYAPYWRLRYLNGGANQTIFRIQATTQAGGDS